MSFDNKNLDDKFFKKYLNYKNKYLELKGGMPCKCHKTNDFNFDEYHRIMDTFGADTYKLLNEDIYKIHFNEGSQHILNNGTQKFKEALDQHNVELLHGQIVLDNYRQLYKEALGQDNEELLHIQIESYYEKLVSHIQMVENYDYNLVNKKINELEINILGINPEIKKLYNILFESDYIKFINLKLLIYYIKLKVDNLIINQKLKEITKITDNYIKYLRILFKKQFLSDELQKLYIDKKLLKVLKDKKSELEKNT